MDQLLKAKQTIFEIQEQLIEYLSSGEDTQDLTHLFSKLSVENPVAYELTLLMYQELHTKAKIDRKKISKVIASILSQNHLTYDRLIQHDVWIHSEEAKAFLKQPAPTVDSTSSSKATSSEPKEDTSKKTTELLQLVLRPNIIYALLISIVTIIATLVITAQYNTDLYNIMLSILKAVLGLNNTNTIQG